MGRLGNIINFLRGKSTTSCSSSYPYSSGSSSSNKSYESSKSQLSCCTKACCSTSSSSSSSSTRSYTKSSSGNDFQPNELGNIKCPDSGRICTTAVCPDKCRGDSTTERKSKYRRIRDSIIPRDNKQAGVSSGKLVSNGGYRTIYTEGNTDEQSNNDGTFGNSTIGANAS
jgi:hypothetical protein